MNSALRSRITPSFPLQLLVKNSDGSSFELSFKLCFDANALGIVEEQTGLNMLEGAAFRGLNVSRLRLLLYAAINRYHGKDYAGAEGLEALGSYLDLENIETVQEAITEAFLISLKKEKADEIRKRIAQAMGEAKGEQNADPLDQTKTE